jgi:hypothetical protein
MSLLAIISFCLVASRGICSADEPTQTPAAVASVAHAIVSRSNLVYDKPAESADAGQPIGNGRMGTMVWTSPTAIHLQINRVDVFAVNCDHLGRPGQVGSATDYCGGIASVTIDVGSQAFAAGEEKPFRQQLSLANAECSIEGIDFQVHTFVSAAHDVLVMELDDRRPQPEPIQVAVSMLRPPEVITGDHIATTRFVDDPKRIALMQQFREREYYNASAVHVGVAKGEPVAVEPSSERMRTLVLPAANGKRIVLITTAAGWKSEQDPLMDARNLFEQASLQSADELRASHQQWWHEFWSRTYVDLSSDDGQAQRAQRWRDLHLYHLASSSRGELPPKWNGSIFLTSGDARRWGSQYWVWTTEMLYFPLLAADAIDLTDPFFNMYARQLPRSEIAARQRWGIAGAYFPETTASDGPKVLADDVAMEFQDVFLGRKPLAEMSLQAKQQCQFDSQLNVVTQPPAGSRMSWISHVASSGSELAIHAWWRYRHTGDREWLRSHAYPLLRGTVEFYRHLVKKEADGLYHLSGTHAHEDFWGVKDSIMDLAAIRGTAPLAIRASEILDVDAELRDQWRELLKNLAPYPMGSNPQAKALTGGALADDIWAAGYLGEVDGQHNPEDVWLTPVFPFEDWTLETRDATADRIVQRLLDLAPRHKSVLNGAGTNTAIRSPIAAARAGSREELPRILDRYAAAFSPLSNGMSLFEGPTAASVEHLGLLTTTLQDALLQSVSPRPGEPEVIRVFPAWPTNWNASFRLLARSGFLVSSKIETGAVHFVEIESRLGEECRLRNPWDRSCIVQEVGGPSQVLENDLLCFPTKRGAMYRISPAR